jgi:arylsulfatase A-like enzyme
MTNKRKARARKGQAKQAAGRKLWGAVAVAMLAVALVFGLRSLLSSPRQNVILIIVDTLRADHIGCYGYPLGTTPNIDKLAAESIRFENAISAAPWTLPSVGTILSGQYPSVLGIRDSMTRLSGGFPLLAELLKQNDYETCGIISNVMLTASTGVGNGFDLYDEDCSAARHRGITSPLITQKAISFLRRPHDKPFLLLIHYFDPHYHYLLHPEYDFYPTYQGDLESGEAIESLWGKRQTMSQDDIKYLLALYDSEVAFTDHYLGMLFSEISRLGLDKNSLIVLTSDHGEEFMEKGWIGHTITLYQELLHVPLLIKTPRSEAQVVPSYVGLIDLMPTILNHLGIDVPDGLDGEAIDLEAAGSPRKRPIFSETFNPQKHRLDAAQKLALRSVLFDGQKLILDQIADTRQFYDLTSDAREQNNLAAQSSQLQEQLQEWLSRYIEYVEQKGKAGSGPATEELFTPEQIKQLRSLGYL